MITPNIGYRCCGLSVEVPGISDSVPFLDGVTFVVGLGLSSWENASKVESMVGASVMFVSLHNFLSWFPGLLHSLPETIFTKYEGVVHVSLDSCGYGNTYFLNCSFVPSPSNLVSHSRILYESLLSERGLGNMDMFSWAFPECWWSQPDFNNNLKSRRTALQLCYIKAINCF